MGTMQIIQRWDWEEGQQFIRKAKDEKQILAPRSDGGRGDWEEMEASGSRRMLLHLRWTQKQRFVIKTEYVNHPLFRDLLEEAESEYGYSSEGPLQLPCEVDRFLGVLDQMDFEDNTSKHKGRTRVIGAITTSLITPPRFLAAVDY
ncbi:UNVERIFIED_CONTAM: Auxin-responsive protein SAUR32 [Sesamum calycinum]|uniref:Auxin-responsive protein SAUR32 n=1 Tax=Sesamum calycinum TaxID=2727403 RepID=A0AAW2QMV4_9LAMI